MGVHDVKNGFSWDVTLIQKNRDLTIKQNYGRIGSSLWKPMTHLVR